MAYGYAIRVSAGKWLMPPIQMEGKTRYPLTTDVDKAARAMTEAGAIALCNNIAGANPLTTFETWALEDMRLVWTSTQGRPRIRLADII
jgi:hypothetical protein